jgi:hypothetical protein
MKGAKGSLHGIKRRGPKMTIDIILCLGLVFSVTSLIATAYERRQDVLYGPYIRGRRRPHPLEIAVRLAAHAIRASGLEQAFARVSWKARNVSCLASAIIC